MKRYACLLVFGFLLSSGGLALAEDRAVNISITSMGGPLDNDAVQSVRTLVGNAITQGTVDTFLVKNPRVGHPILIEGGLIACAEAGFTAKKSQFNSFIRKLRAIEPKEGTAYSLERTPVCAMDENVVCTDDVKQCPDGSYVGRVPPSCEFAPCPGE